ncbi:predicted protein [Naegleria gruberi]|uniref:phosphatidylinositol 3-kinase n=1 Tax=Naegleria gruberi TaxID=5762 RepID=D2VSC9_NAEGR|nr:uncharacterized protein NAEGRDRAFT_81057 [Naegleria gruberi]EFC40323.1 predicted protein [Naegleria gruberi]|eukprot:XP_002673067.1 predicted protein [Naegleria gruberi strain NEG-M]
MRFFNRGGKKDDKNKNNGSTTTTPDNSSGTTTTNGGRSGSTTQTPPISTGIQDSTVSGSPTSMTPTSTVGSGSSSSNGGENSPATVAVVEGSGVNVKSLITKTLTSLQEIWDIHGEFLTVTADEEDTKQKLSKLTKSEIRKHIDLLIGKREEWSSESDEAFAYRYNIRKAHVMSENKSIERGDLLPPVYLTSDTTFDPSIKFFCKVNLVGDNFQRMVDCEPYSSADDFAELFINKINKSHLLNRRKEDWIFKATGTSEYIYGNQRMIDFEVIRRCLKRGINRVQLNLMDKETVLKELDPYDMNLRTTEYDFDFKRTPRYSMDDHERFKKIQKDIRGNKKHIFLHYNRFKGVQTYSSYTEDEFSKNSSSTILDDDEWISKIDQTDNNHNLTQANLTMRDSLFRTEELIRDKKAFTLWDIHRPFRLKIVGLDNIPLSEDRAIYITAQVFLGGMPLTNCRITKCVIQNRNPRFNQYITFPELYISELPREAKICITAFSKPYVQNDPHLIVSNRSPTIQDMTKLASSTIKKGVITGNETLQINTANTQLQLGTSPSMISNPTEIIDIDQSSAASSSFLNGDEEDILEHEQEQGEGGKKSKKDKTNVPVAGMNFQLFNFCGTLKQGVYCLKVEPNREAKPIMTSGESKDSKISMTFSLDEYLLPIVYPDDEDSFSSIVTTDQTNTSFSDTLNSLKQTKDQLTRSLSTTEGGMSFNPLTQPRKTQIQNTGEQSKPVAPNRFKKHLPEIFIKRFEEYVAKKNSESLPPGIAEKKLEKVLNYDPLKTLNSEERWLCFLNRDKLIAKPKALSKFLLSVPWKFPEARLIAKEYLAKWNAIEPIDALELLDHNFGASFIREYSIGRLNQLSDQQLCNYLLQLVQTLKYESYHDSSLARFLLQRGLRSPNIIGHILFWHLKAEMYVPSIRERHGLILEEYLRNCGSHRIALLQQTGVLHQLNVIAEGVKIIDKEECKEYVKTCLAELKHPPKFKLPLSPRMEVKGIEVDRCRVMSSKKKPLWLVFQNADATGDPIQVMFKAGDDLRQDLLTLQILSIMDQLWKKKGLDLHMNPYGCICTGDQQGFIEIVVDSDTVANITAGDTGGISGGIKAFTSAPLEIWLLKNNGGVITSPDYEKAVQNFALSCAGYCAATYVLGIGDRHNDNIMLTRKGDLFHIDFGHFLGNFKSYKGIYKRETTPFVFTPMYAQVMKSFDSENKGKCYYSTFEEKVIAAYQILRENGHLIMNLFLLMLATGIPELTSVSDIKWLRDCLVLDKSPEEAEQHFRDKITKALANTKSQFNDFVHIVKHK